MSETRKQSTRLMHPQFRNIHNKIFGGYLMREAFELAWNITYIYCKRRPQFLSMEHMYFYKPVEIGSILSFTGMVIYSTSRSLMVEVTTEMLHPDSGTNQVTNACYFTFTVAEEKGLSWEITQVLPHTHEEGLKYLDGAKRYRLGLQQRRSEKQNSHDFGEELAVGSE